MVSQILISNQILMIESLSRGLFFNCNGGVVSWKSSKQDVTINSIIEDVYIAALDVAIEAVWIRKFASMLGVVPFVESHIPLFCDNNGFIAWQRN